MTLSYFGKRLRHVRGQRRNGDSVEPISYKGLSDGARDQIKKLGDGCLLLAREGLEDPNFKITVVLICVHNADGAFGLVLNRPSHMPLSEVFDVDVVQKLERRKIYIGGPVQQDALQIVQLTDGPARNAYRVAPGVHLGGEWNALADILAADQSTTRLFLGYSGWGPGQLEAEIAVGAWEVYNVDVNRLLRGPEDKLIGDVDAIRSYIASLA
ncbi:MAG: hypothetical protein GF418_00895 [Chitinivibrionales bacterium]|nr:hypothetical protein [Chitinivibrionales bacterium]MBD3394158.1 hypothetical protein [Chitinivibrionales bacterium]